MKYIKQFYLYSIVLFFACSSGEDLQRQTLKKNADKEESVKTAVTYFRNRNFESALNILEKIDLNDFAYDFEVLNYLGMIYYYKDDFKMAREYFRKSIARKNDFADPHNNLAYTYLLEKRYDLALKSFDAAIRIDPLHENALNNRKLLDKLLSNQISLQTVEMFGQTLKLEELPHQVASYKKILEENPKLKEARNNLAVCMFYLNKKDSAMQIFQSILEDYPTYHEAHNNIAFIYHDLRDYEMAVRHFITAIKFKATYTIALINLGDLYFNMKDYKKAEKVWRAVLNVEPSNEMAIYRIKKLAEIE